VKAGLGAPFIDDLGYLHRRNGVTALGRKAVIGDHKRATKNSQKRKNLSSFATV
jgi:hypothetical protein